MNLSEDQIESVLRTAPVPRPPASLRGELVPGPVAGTTLPTRDSRPTVGGPGVDRGGRWWWILLPGLATAALATALVHQQGELSEIHRELAQLESATAIGTEAATALAATPAAGVDSSGAEARADLERLRALVLGLREDVAELMRNEAEVERLRVAIREATARLSKEQQAMLAMPERAQSIRCVNHMKQLGLAVRVWANDNGDEFPPTTISMTNELATPKILVCPSDENRTVAPDWASFGPGNLSYEFLAAGPGKHVFEVHRIMWRCPIHGHVTLCDGSVQMGLAKTQPERFETRDGGVYLKPEPARQVEARPPTQPVPQGEEP